MKKQQTMGQTGQWSELGEDLLRTIEEKLVLYVDKVRFRSVCISWRSILSKMPNHQARQIPWLFHALNNDREASHGLFNPVEKKVYLLDLPEAQGKLYKGSSNGWVATVEDNISTGPAIYLMNPLTRSRIKLPPRTKFPDVQSYDPDKLGYEYALLINCHGSKTIIRGATNVNRNLMDKIVLSSTPSRDDCVVVSIYGLYGRLAYCKRNDEKWTSFCNEHGMHIYVDIIFHKGKLHALKPQGQLLVFENMDPNSKVKQIASQLPRRTSSELYLAECSDGGLIMVARHGRELPREEDCEGVLCFNKTSSFRVYKHDPINLNWFMVKSIGDHEILFVGHNSCMPISCRDFPGFKGNRIYFTDNVSEYHKKGIQGGSAIRVFNLDDRTIESLSGFKCNPMLVWPPPVWVIPSLY